MFTQGQRASSALRFSDKKEKKEMKPMVKGGILEKYELYGNSLDFDVIYTIKNGIADMENKYKSKKLQDHYEHE